MSMFNRISMRALLTSSIVALALGGCSFSYSSGSAPPNHSHSNHGKKMPSKSSSPKKVDNREKPLPSKSGEKPLTKADPTPDPTPAPEREVNDDAPERTKTAPKRTKGAPKRTPTGTPDDTVEAEEDVSPSSAGSFKAKTKPATPPSSSGTLVAPQ